MKQSVIKDIFSGKRGHMQTMEMRANPQSNKEESEILRQLKTNLDSELYNQLQHLLDLREETFREEIEFYFEEGFKLGLQLGIECKT